MAEDINKLLPWTDPRVNNHIVSSTINYYGHGLLKQLADTKRHLLPYAAMKDINYQSFKARAHKLGEPDEVKLYTTSVDFILNNADFLFSQPVSKSKRAEDPSKYGFKDKYKNLPPLEYYLQTNKKLRAAQFYKDLRRGDLLVCRAMQPPRGAKHQPLRVVFRDAGPHMFVGKNFFLNVNLDISQTRVPKIDEGSVPNTWTINTLVRVEVLSISCEADYEKADIIVGTMGDTLLENNRLDVSLGKVNRSAVPEIINAVESYTKDSVGSYDANMKKMESFKNPRCVQHLAKQLNLSLKNTSLMSTLRNDFTTNSRHRQLRRLQLTRWAHKHVADGVAHFKKGEHAEAFQLLNKALSIDTENVEAFVAKGALLANMGSFEKAVEDFESALKYNPDHGNARKYICETLLELGKRHEDDGKLGAAESCYARALKVNAEHTSSLEAITRLHARTGFKSSLALEVLKKKEKDGEKKQQPILAQEKNTKPEDLSVEEVLIISDHSDEETSAPSEKLRMPRERSLSPLAQKLAMQSNAWKPPSYIDTTNSYLTTPMRSGAQDDVRVAAATSSNSQTKSEVHVRQAKSYDHASTSMVDVHATNTDSHATITKSGIYTVAGKTLSKTSSSQSDTTSKSKIPPRTSKYGVCPTSNVTQMTTASDLPSKSTAHNTKQRKESVSITPFVVGANKSAAAAAATAAATAPDGKIDQVSSVLVAFGTSSKSVYTRSVVSSAGQSVSTTAPVSQSVASITVSSSDASCSTGAVPGVLLSSPVVTSITTSASTSVPTSSAEDNPVRENTMLDRNFQNALKVTPNNSDEIEVLSLTLIMLSRKFKAAGDKERARLCLKKSLKHNPKHEPTSRALQELENSSLPPASKLSTQPQSMVVSNAPVPSQPISTVPLYQGPPPEMGFSAFYVPPPNFVGVPPPNQLDVTCPPPLIPGGYGLPYNVPLNMAGPPPGYGEWGTASVGPPEAPAVQPQISQEDKEYHEKVDSFLKHIMNRNPVRPSKSSSRSPSPASPRSSRRWSPRALSAGKSRSRPERRSPYNISSELKRERWNADQKRGRESRDRHSQSPRDWRGQSRDNRLLMQDQQSPIRDRPQLRDGRPPPSIRWSPSRGQLRDHPPQSWDQPSQSHAGTPHSRRSRSRSSQHDKTKAASRSESQVVPSEGMSAKSSLVSANSGESKSRPRDADDKPAGRTTKKRHKEEKKKRHRHKSSGSGSTSGRSSSSSSSSSSSRSSSSHSSGHPKRKKEKKKKSKKRQTTSKFNLKSIGLADDPALQNIDKELLRKISEKLYQSNMFLGDAKDVGKKKKRKRTRDSDKSGTEDEKEKKKKKSKEILQKSVDEHDLKKRRKGSETLTDPRKVPTKEKPAKALSINKYVKKKELPSKDAVVKTKEEQMELLEKEQLKEIAQKYLTNTVKKSAVALPKEDSSKQLTEEGSSASLQRLMQLPGLEDLQKKLKSFYTKCENKAEEPVESQEDLILLKLKPSNYLVKKPAAPKLSSLTCSTKNISHFKPASEPTNSIVKQETKSSPSETPKKAEVLPSSSSASKPAINAKVPSVFKSAVQSVITQSKKEPLLPMGPATPELLKRRPTLETVAPPAAATVSAIADSSEDTKSRFKSTFKPVSPTKPRLSILKMSLIEPDGSILTPSEFKSGLRSKAQEKMNAVLEKAQDVAENISKLKENWRPDADKKLCVRQSAPGPSKNRSRSTSKSRERRSKSRSRRSRSKSLDRGRRSRSRSRDRSPFRGGNKGWNPGRFRGRYQRGFGDRYHRGGFSHKKRHQTRSRSRSRSPRHRRRRSRSYGSRSRSRSPGRFNKAGKDSMFGKWATDASAVEKKAERPGKSLEELQKFLAESKEKKLQQLKERNLQFQKPPDN